MVMFALMMFLLSIIIFNFSLLTSMPYSLARVTCRFVRCSMQFVAAALPQVYVVCKTEVADRPATNSNGSVIFVDVILLGSLRVNIDESRRT